jgi:hypothetical protein
MYLASQTQMLGEDEVSYYVLGKDFSSLRYPAFDDLGRNLPLSPFTSLLYAVPFMVFGSSLALAKMIIAFFGALTLIMVYLIGKKINIWYGIIAAFLLLSITLFTNFMFISYEEVPIAFFSALVTYLLLSLDSTKKAILIGVITSVATLTKQSGLLLLVGIFIYIIFLYFNERDKKYIKFLIVSFVAALVLIMPFIIRNFIIYKYTYMYGLNFLFKNPSVQIPLEGVSNKMLSPSMLTIQNYISNFGWIIVISSILGFSWFLVEISSGTKITKQLFFFVSFSAVFILIYYFFYFFDLAILEPRYFFLIFPQISLLGSFFFLKLKERNRYLIMFVLVIVALSFYSSISIALSTASTQRYPSDYIDALKWIKQNTKNDSIILTTYGGSLKYFADRNNIWTDDMHGDLPSVMESTNSSYIYDVIKKYNVSYILVWRGVLGQNFIIPQSNLYGVFTYTFLNSVLTDSSHFNVTYQNQDNIIFKLN